MRGAEAEVRVVDVAEAVQVEALAAELRGRGVTVTVLCPSFFDTNLLADTRFAAPELGLVAS